MTVDDTLREAIRQVMMDKATDDELPNLLLTDFVVAYACARADNPEITNYGAAYPDGGMPGYRALGLIEMLRHQLLTTGWDDDDG